MFYGMHPKEFDHIDNTQVDKTSNLLFFLLLTTISDYCSRMQGAKRSTGGRAFALHGYGLALHPPGRSGNFLLIRPTCLF